MYVEFSNDWYAHLVCVVTSGMFLASIYVKDKFLPKLDPSVMVTK